MDQLMFNANQNVQAYIYNFILDFFSVSAETLEYFYALKINRKEVNDQGIVWKMKEQHGNKYKVTNISKTMKFTYTLRNRRYVYIRK